MIFGFNTDVKHSDTVYHVQSEARESEQVLQTQVFVRGRCIGKRATSYAEKLSPGGFNDQQKEQGLRDQHRMVLDSIRDGKLESILDKRESPEALAVVKELDLEWVNAASVHTERNLTLRLRVTEGGSGVGGARLTFRFARPDGAPFYTQATTDSAGQAEMKFDLDESVLPDASVLIQANYAGRTATRKFRLRKIE
jgi:hypothetical protein